MTQEIQKDEKWKENDMDSLKLEDKEGTFREVSVGIVFWGMICELAGVWFVKKPLSYSLGIGIGILTALYYMYHMLWALEHSLEYGEEYATKNIRKHSIIRYMVLVLIMFVLIYTNQINPLSWFLALMGVKASVYLQPFTHKILLGKEGRAQEKQVELAAIREYEERVAKEGYPDEENEEEEDESFFTKRL